MLIYFEFRRSLHWLLSFAQTLTRPTNFNRLRQDGSIVFSYSQRIPVSFSWLFHYFSFFLVILRYLLIFTKIILLLLFYYIFFHKNYFYFCMFRDVPECSMFLVLLTASRKSLSGGFRNTSDYLAKNHKHLSAASNSEISVKDRKQSFKTLSYTSSAFLENQ